MAERGKREGVAPSPAAESYQIRNMAMNFPSYTHDHV